MFLASQKIERARKLIEKIGGAGASARLPIICQRANIAQRDYLYGTVAAACR